LPAAKASNTQHTATAIATTQGKHENGKAVGTLLMTVYRLFLA